MALDPDLIDHWLIWICLWDEFVRHASVPFVAVCITLCRLLSVRIAYRQRGIGEQTLKCYLRCYFGVLFEVLLYMAGARNLSVTGREGGIEGC